MWQIQSYRKDGIMLALKPKDRANKTILGRLRNSVTKEGLTLRRKMDNKGTRFQDVVGTTRE